MRCSRGASLLSAPDCTLWCLEAHMAQRMNSVLLWLDSQACQGALAAKIRGHSLAPSLQSFSKLGLVGMGGCGLGLTGR